MTSHSHRIDELVEELCLVDPSFNDNKAQLRELVARMLEDTPQWEPDQSFIHSLKTQLSSSTKTESSFGESRYLSFFSMIKKSFFLEGAAAVLSISLILGVVYMQRATLFAEPSVQVQQTRFAMLEPAAFGSLADMAVADNLSESAPDMASSRMMVSQGDAEPLIGAGGGNGMAATSKLIAAPYPGVQVSYEYIGEDLTLPTADEYPVFAYKVGEKAYQALHSAIRGVALPIDVNAFDNPMVTLLEVKEQKDDRAYTTFMDLTSGQHSIGIDYDSWPELRCENGCDQRELTDADLPSDNELIARAQQFITQKGIDLSIYGEPVVPKPWLSYRADDSVYIPGTISVVYPIELPSGIVYEQYGDVYGLSVSVDIAHDIITGVHNIYSGQFVGSAYKLENDTEKVLAVAQSGASRYYPMYDDSLGERDEVVYQLDTPEVVYIQHYASSDVLRRLSVYTGGYQNTLYLPALRFPVLGETQDGAYKPEYITVPLLADVLDTYTNEKVPVLPTEPVLY